LHPGEAKGAREERLDPIPLERESPRMKYRFPLILVAISGVVACTTRLTPQAEAVRVTRNSADVTACKQLGFVESRPPYSTPNDAMNEMRNKVAILGGNVLFITNYGIKATGVAYVCGGAPIKK
jgi:hypothetical protein